MNLASTLRTTLIPFVLLTAGTLLAGPKASIHVRGNPHASQRVSIAKVSFEEAMKAALAAAPGKVASGDLEVDDGNLIYDFVIIASGGKAVEVTIDAGNGKVLSIEDGDDE